MYWEKFTQGGYQGWRLKNDNKKEVGSILRNGMCYSALIAKGRANCYTMVVGGKILRDVVEEEARARAGLPDIIVPETAASPAEAKGIVEIHLNLAHRT